jgi:ABC-type transport system substrate-binding protein
MPPALDIRKVVLSLKKFRFNLFKEVRSIDFTKLPKPEIVWKSVLESSRVIKTIFVASIIGIFCSSGLIIYGFYLVLTKEVPTNGGEIREAVVDSDMSIFNPVTQYVSDAEQRVNSLLYHPLYSMEYPDFLSAPTTPVLTPILLEKAPQWQDLTQENPTNRYKKLRFTLRKNIRWSNNEPITLEDVRYSYEMIRGEGKDSTSGNPQFRSVFQQTKFVPVNEIEFDLITETSNPQLLYNANFSPISKMYYSGLNSDRLGSDSRSIKPTVTSGPFSFAEGTVQDPDSTKQATIDNPSKDPNTGAIRTVVLSKNPVQNINNTPYADKYIIRKYGILQDKGGQNNQSLERAAKDGRVDILFRSIQPQTPFSSTQVAASTGLSQKKIPSNTFYNLYLNTQKDQYFINQTLRKYVLCEFTRFNLNDKYTEIITNLPADQRIIPLHFKTPTPPNCPENSDGILDPTKYSISNANGKQVILSRAQVEITLAATPDTEPLLTEVKNYFESIGLKVGKVITDPTELTESLRKKTYNAVFLPITHVSNDPYSLYGANSQNLSNIVQNTRGANMEIEKNLKDYSASNLTNETAKTNIIDFFKNEFVSINLFRGIYELNYSKRIVKNENSPPFTLPNVITFPADLSVRFQEVWFKTKRAGR